MSALDPATLFDLLARGVPWPIAVDGSVASPRSIDERVQLLRDRLTAPDVPDELPTLP